MKCFDGNQDLESYLVWISIECVTIWLSEDGMTTIFIKIYA